MHEYLNHFRETGNSNGFTHRSAVWNTTKETAPAVESSSFELYAILDALRGLDAKRQDAVLCTVVQTGGSAYRRPGARLLVLRDGARVGCVVGPLLESEIVQRAWWLTESGAPVVQTYGPASVLLERSDSAELFRMTEFLEAHRKTRKPAVVATVTEVGKGQRLRIGDRLLLDESWARAGALVGSPIEAEVLTHAAAALREKKSRSARLGRAAVFVEWIGPPLSLVVLGGGRDAGALVRMGRQLGWDVTLTEGSLGVDPLDGIAIDANTAVVVMTHNYALDARLLPRVLACRPVYVGLLGPRKRAERLFDEIGTVPGANIFAPAGLDIGGDTPEMIALSIVAEVQAKVSHRGGGPLKRRRGDIHAATPEKGLPADEASQAEERFSLARQG
jgi:xanthine/CO dehydrogenase XdhC/CoxF family maturation factor